MESHQQLPEKHHLPFPLLADEDAAVSKLYGVYKQKNVYGKKYDGHRAHDVRDRQDRADRDRSIRR